MIPILTALGIALGTLVAGFVVAWIFLKKQEAIAIQQERERYEWLEKQWKEEQEKADRTAEQRAEAENRLARAEEQNHNLKKDLEEQEEQVEKLQKEFTERFENLANKIFEEKTKKNKEQIEEVVKPYKEQLAEFKKKVEETHEKDIEAHTRLMEKIKTLSELNERMREEAVNLTRALKSDTKKQGSWGEFVLARILESSGLEKGREYETEKHVTAEDGSRYRPDVLIHLPEDKKIVIDSKVSLVAYERYINKDENRKQHLKQHLLSLKNHIKQLSEKNYHDLFEESPEFVLLFIPIEPALTAALNAEPELFDFAFQKKVVLVTPTTLLATLKTISSIWKNEYRNRHVMQIADEAGKMYDKFELFVEALQKVGDNLRQARDAYDLAENRLTTGRGNLVSKAEKIKNLGAKAQKKLPEDLVRKALEEDRGNDATDEEEEL